MEQSGNSWLTWRKKGLGSSDAPIIMGISPYKTPHQLWVEKTSDGLAEQKENFIFEKGHRVEAIIRARIELQTGQTWQPKLYERSDKPYIRCSMDCANDELQEGKETKYVGKEVFKNKIVPPHYICQIQHQYLVTGFKRITCVMITDDKELCDGADLIWQEIEVPVDHEYCKKLFEKEVQFREHHIEKRVPPELTVKDAVPVKDKEVQKQLKRYKLLKERIDSATSELNLVKEEIFKGTTHALMSYGDIMIKESERKGAVDYDRLLKHHKILDVEQFRKANSKVRSITC
jgi:putative phage-type endonuclease